MLEPNDKHKNNVLIFFSSHSEFHRASRPVSRISAVWNARVLSNIRASKQGNKQASDSETNVVVDKPRNNTTLTTIPSMGLSLFQSYAEAQEK